MKTNKIRFAILLSCGRVVCPELASAHVDVYASLSIDEQEQIVGAGYVIAGEYHEGGDLSTGLAIGYPPENYYGAHEN